MYLGSALGQYHFAAACNHAPLHSLRHTVLADQLAWGTTLVPSAHLAAPAFDVGSSVLDQGTYLVVAGNRTYHTIG